MEWVAASVRVHLPEQGDSGHITHGVGGCSCPGSSAGAGRQWPCHSWSGRLHLSMRLPEQGDSGHITRGVGGCICPGVCRSRETVATSLVEWEAASVHASAGAGRQWPHHSGVEGCICPCVCRSRETVATSLVEWEAASVHASAGAGRQWPHHSWSGRLHLSMRLPEQGDSGHITRGVGGCICPGRLPELGDSGHITHGVGGCICPCVCRSRETVATSLRSGRL